MSKHLESQTHIYFRLIKKFALVQTFRYRGEYYDVETATIYLRARYYNPSNGRFTQRDSFAGIKSDPLSLNLYTYCLNNPILGIDPTGHMPHWLKNTLKIAGSAAITAAGVALCATGVGATVGVGLTVAGGSMLASNIMDAAGVESKTASQISAGLDIVSGTALCFVPGAQGIGASMIGSGVGSFAGGYISEKLGGSYELGSAIGGIFGGFASNGIYKGLQNSGKISTRVRLDSIKFNPDDDMMKIGPSDKALSYWTKQLSRNPKGYNSIPGLNGEIEPLKIIKNSGNMLANGHHRVYAMKTRISNAPKYINVFNTK